MTQLATTIIRPVPRAEIRAAEVREMYRQRFPHEWVAMEVAVIRVLLDKPGCKHFYVKFEGAWVCRICGQPGPEDPDGAACWGGGLVRSSLVN